MTSVWNPSYPRSWYREAMGLHAHAAFQVALCCHVALVALVALPRRTKAGDILSPYGNGDKSMSSSRCRAFLGAMLASVGILAGQDAATPVKYVVVIFQEN